METKKITFVSYFIYYFWIFVVINILFFIIYQMSFLLLNPLADGFPLTKEMGFPDVYYKSVYNSAWLMLLVVIFKFISREKNGGENV